MTACWAVEIHSPAPFYDTNMKAKNLGFIGFPNHTAYSDGRVYNAKSATWLRFHLDNTTHGYLRVNLAHNGHIETWKIHRLLALCFIPNPDSLPCVNHKDGDKTNNDLDNLEWCTFTHNIVHAYKTGLNQRMDDRRIHAICAMLANGARVKEVVDVMGVSQSLVTAVKRGVKYKDIASKYDIESGPPQRERLSTSNVEEICHMLSTKSHTLKSIATLFNVSEDTIGNIYRGITFKSISSKYDFGDGRYSIAA